MNEKYGEGMRNNFVVVRQGCEKLGAVRTAGVPESESFQGGISRIGYGVVARSLLRLRPKGSWLWVHLENNEIHTDNPPSLVPCL